MACIVKPFFVRLTCFLWSNLHLPTYNYYTPMYIYIILHIENESLLTLRLWNEFSLSGKTSCPYTLKIPLHNSIRFEWRWLKYYDAINFTYLVLILCVSDTKKHFSKSPVKEEGRWLVENWENNCKETFDWLWVTLAAVIPVDIILHIVLPDIVHWPSLDIVTS